MNRYEVLANAMAAEIRSGSIAVGSRTPSLRQIIAQHGVSQSTVFRADYLLEEWGLVRAQERSGYASVTAARTPRTASLAESSKVDISDLVFSVLDAAKTLGIAPLGSAFPSPHLFPLPRLAKSLAQASRLISPWSTVVDLPRAMNTCAARSLCVTWAWAYRSQWRRSSLPTVRRRH
jgi:DNA-binding transcriptional MocR family regulator